MNTYALDVSKSVEQSKERGLYVGEVKVRPQCFMARDHEIEVAEAWIERGTRVWQRLVAKWEASRAERSSLVNWLTRPHPPKEARTVPPFVLAFRLSSPTLPADGQSDTLLVWEGAGGYAEPIRVGYVYRDPQPSPLPSSTRVNVQHESSTVPSSAIEFLFPAVHAGAV